jgi:hypothetical protein
MFDGDLGFALLRLPNGAETAADDFFDDHDWDGLLIKRYRGCTLHIRGISEEYFGQDVRVEGVRSRGSASRSA